MPWREMEIVDLSFIEAKSLLRVSARRETNVIPLHVILLLFCSVNDFRSLQIIVIYTADHFTFLPTQGGVHAMM